MRTTLLSGCAAVVIAASASAWIFTPTVAEAQRVSQSDPRVVASLDNWGYDRIYRQGWSANRLMDDASVYGPLGEEIGSVENIILSQQGKVLGIIAQVGGFWDIGDTHVFVPWDQVSVSPTLDRVTIPVTEENVENYGGAPSVITRTLSNRLRVVDDDLNAGVGLWKATDLIGDYVYLGNRVEYGHVNDLIFNRNGALYAYVVNADALRGGGYYALPYGYDANWTPGLGYYNAPYSDRDVRSLEPFQYDRMNRRVNITNQSNRNPEREPRQSATVWTFNDIDADGNLELTEVEFARVGQDLFRRWDQNGDNRVTSDELYSGLFSVFDRNGDSRVSEREFSNGWRRWGRGIDQRVSFAEMDRNDDGFLTQRDFRRGLNRVGFHEPWIGNAREGMTERRFTSRVYGLWDSNRDGVVDNREFAEASAWF